MHSPGGQPPVQTAGHSSLGGGSGGQTPLVADSELMVIEPEPVDCVSVPLVVDGSAEVSSIVAAVKAVEEGSNVVAVKDVEVGEGSNVPVAGVPLVGVPVAVAVPIVPLVVELGPLSSVPGLFLLE